MSDQLGRKPSRRRSNSDQLLLETTSRLLSERNTIEISLSEIAAASGLNSALIKYHFGNKEGLLVALVKRDTTRPLEQMEKLSGLSIGYQQKLRQHLSGIIRTFEKSPYFNRLLNGLLDSDNKKVAQEVTDLFIKPVVGFQRRLLEEGAAAGEFRTVDPMMFYLATMGACDMLYQGRSTLHRVFDVEQLTPELRQSYTDFVCESALRMVTRN